jgi:Fungal protein kinase
MSDDELGMNIYIKEDKAGKCIMRNDERKEEKLYLEDRPIAFQRATVCRGTTYYRAKRQKSKHWEFVVKFSWQSDKRRAEGDLLRLANGTCGVLLNSLATKISRALLICVKVWNLDNHEHSSWPRGAPLARASQKPAY